MNRGIVVYGLGGVEHAYRLRDFFQMRYVRSDWEPGHPRTPDVLHLTSVDMGFIDAEIDVYSIRYALQVSGIEAAELRGGKVVEAAAGIVAKMDAVAAFAYGAVAKGLGGPGAYLDGTPVTHNKNAGDPINPSHYKTGAVECIDAIESALSREEYIGFLRGQIIKYQWRCRLKGGAEDVRKSLWYGERLAKLLESAPC